MTIQEHQEKVRAIFLAFKQGKINAKEMWLQVNEADALWSKESGEQKHPVLQNMKTGGVVLFPRQGKN